MMSMARKGSALVPTVVERPDGVCDHPPMSAIEQPTLETARLRLRPLETADADALNVIQSDPVHMRFYPHPFSLDESREWIDRDARTRASETASRCWRSKTARRGSSWATWDRSCSTSTAWMRWSWDGRSRPRAPGRGSRRRRRSACRDWAFEALPVDHLISLILPDNAPSRGVAEHLGMTVWKDVLWGTAEAADALRLSAGPACGGRPSEAEHLADPRRDGGADGAVSVRLEVDAVDRARGDVVAQIQERRP